MSQPTTDHKEIRNWAENNHLVPTILLPEIHDHEPAIIRLMYTQTARRRPDVQVLAWDDFFARFDQLGLALVYDHDSTGQNELLQQEESNPWKSRAYQLPKTSN